MLIVLSEVDHSDMLKSLCLKIMEFEEIKILYLGNVPPLFIRESPSLAQCTTTTGSSRLPWQISSLIYVSSFLLTHRKSHFAIYSSGRHASFSSMTVGYFLKFSTRIFTRHHGSIHHLKAQRFSTLIDIVTSFFATKVIAVSQCTRAILHEKERVPQHKIKLIHNGIDLSRFTNPKVIDSRKNRDSDRRKSQMFRIGVVSRTEDWKSVHQIAKAFRIFLRNTVNAELIIVGAPGNAENLLASELKDIPSDNYQRIPFINDIEAFFSEIDLFVHVPTGECVEAFGLVYLEALASGVPSIFSINGILTEIHFSDSRNALVPSGEEFKLERHIYEAYLKWRDGTQQRERDVEITKFIGHFSIDRMVSQYLKLFYQ